MLSLGVGCAGRQVVASAPSPCGPSIVAASTVFVRHLRVRVRPVDPTYPHPGPLRCPHARTRSCTFLLSAPCRLRARCVQATPGAPLDVDLSDPKSAGMIDWGTFAPMSAGCAAPGVACLTGTNDGPYKMVGAAGQLRAC